MASQTPNLKVHHLRNGQGERIPFLLEELSLPYTLVPYTRSPLLAPPELKSLHPMGASPVLEDLTNPSAPLKLAESGAIVEYLINVHGGGKLALGPAHKDYADYLYWFHFSNANLQPGVFRRALVRGLAGEEDARFAAYDARLKGTLSFVDERLRGSKWLAGEEFTAADVMSMWCFTTMRTFEPFDLTGYEGILRWMREVAERPAYRRAMEKGDPELVVEELISAKGPQLFRDGMFSKAMQAPPKK
ncbi:glutathione S-transferase [Aaosphaeria arxii CBS 175.79]|uniref:Glutathione S-transferase n=1 Tax=Aaosphaeria arxii CBS 175.79 TaxID=1450172 RepID=A0A6A5Y596_9PLEO|nr:glutathione S-transferase [Aaosphaeria arxii CBS 175.79]KAF2020449.1 glutathione S-transferase [Aaosphaeria arxii CBS 175.79]